MVKPPLQSKEALLKCAGLQLLLVCRLAEHLLKLHETLLYGRLAIMEVLLAEVSLNAELILYLSCVLLPSCAFAYQDFLHRVKVHLASAPLHSNELFHLHQLSLLRQPILLYEPPDVSDIRLPCRLLLAHSVRDFLLDLAKAGQVRCPILQRGNHLSVAVAGCGRELLRYSFFTWAPKEAFKYRQALVHRRLVALADLLFICQLGLKLIEMLVLRIRFGDEMTLRRIEFSLTSCALLCQHFLHGREVSFAY
mmetsp:Transcript_130405/g.278649  ORF Transcript_130405/g.278649 Transcript_130405/m.278649 type:complete len:251 (-) Transcript_130405:983-1735(-)